MVFESGERTTILDPKLHFLLSPITHVIVVAWTTMLAPAVSVQFKKDRAGAAASLERRLLTKANDFQHIVAVTLGCGNAKTADHFKNLAACGLADFHQGLHGELIVFTHHDERELVQSGKIDSFIEYAFFNGTVAKESHRDA